MNRLTCDCGRTLGYEPRHAGKKVRCPGCQTVLVVPEEEEIPEVEAVEDDPPPRGKKSSARSQESLAEDEPARPRRSRRDEAPDEAEEERPRRSRRDEEDEEEAEPKRPRRKRRKAASIQRTGFFASLGELLNAGPAVGILCVMGAIGIGLCVYGFTEWRVSAGATATPQAMTCQQLIDGGVPANPHVLVTDVIPADNYVYNVKVTQAEKNSGNTAGKPWDSVYLPLLPLTPALRTMMARGENFVPKPPANQIRVILLSRKAKNINDLANLFAQGSVQGLIVNSINKLDSETENLLRQSYPGADLTRVLILEEGRKPSSAAFAFTMLGIGAALIVVAAGLGGIALVFKPNR